MSAPDAVKALVRRFERNRDEYLRGYNEAQVRQEFINPLFRALGWDIENRAGRAEAYKEVIHEDVVAVAGAKKAPDYSFRIGGVRKFFLEAKRPSVNIDEDAAPAFQLRRYAWSAKLPLSILTNFRQFAVYDCRFRPDHADRPAVARIQYLTSAQFLERWDDIASVFSQEAILQGAFDKYAASTKNKRGTMPVDAAFLADIEGWRRKLAENLALRNAELSQKELNFAVQRIIDRVVFLRICEDRGIEPEGQLQADANSANVYESLCRRFKRADERYNSGLFHFESESGRNEDPDRLTLDLTIDDRVLKDIIRGLYYPESPYEFSVLSPDILGQVYEQFLGQVIKLSPAHRATVEPKPEVKHAGGVYYTPTYVVDHIVERTLGKLLEGKSPRHAANIRVLDPACGSGSFLIAAYQYLLDWHLDWYLRDGAEKHPRDVVEVRAKNYQLTTATRKRILLANVFGVDIDAQAVEVTKLSLLLKVLEGESGQNLERQLRMFHQRALPDLGKNIKCGNSLVDASLAGRNYQLLPAEEKERVNAFSWADEFPVARRGFDAIIGNPPYISIQTLTQFAPPLFVQYLRDNYKAASYGNCDIYLAFVERALSLLSGRGTLGFILPSKFFTTDYGQPLRKLLTEPKALREVVDFGHGQVFDGPTTYTCLLFLSARPQADFSVTTVPEPRELGKPGLPQQRIKAHAVSDAPWDFTPREVKAAFAKASKGAMPLLDLPSKIARGSSTGADAVFMLVGSPGHLKTREGESVTVENELLRVPIYATDFGRYRFAPKSGERVVFPYEKVGDRYQPIPEAKLRSEFPLTYEYLKANRAALAKRRQVRVWYAFSAARSLEVHEVAQLAVPLLAREGSFCALPADSSKYCLMAGGGFSVSVQRDSHLPLYVLGLMNSTLLFQILRSMSNVFRGGWITCTKQYVGKVPVRVPSQSDATGKRLFEEVVECVSGVLDARKQLETSPVRATRLLRDAQAMERRIDDLVYRIYGTTDSERKVIDALVLDPENGEAPDAREAEREDEE
jgi:type I restriction-modification system DNA methylase subunit